MRARHKPAPRTDEDRAARTATRERFKDGLRTPVDEGWIEAVLAARPELASQPRKVIEAVANIFLLSSIYGRRHEDHPDCFWLHHNELEGAFRRTKFEKFAADHCIAFVAHRKRTRSHAWKLDPDFAGRAADALAARCRAIMDTAARAATTGTVETLPVAAIDLRETSTETTSKAEEPTRLPSATAVAEAPAALREVRPSAVLRWTARHNLQGLSKSLVGDATLTPVVPIDVRALMRFYDVLTEIDGLPADSPERRASLDTWGMEPTDSIERRRKLVVTLVNEALRNVDGYGCITHEYRMAPTGRLYATGLSLQRAPKEITRCALLGGYVYDFENCHFTIIAQIAASEGIECPGIAYYLANKAGFRQDIAEWCGIPISKAKTCVIGIGYGAGSYDGAGQIVEEIGRLAMNRLFMHPDVWKIVADLEAIRPLLRQRYTRRYAGKVFLTNALGIRFKPEERRALRKNRHKKRLKLGPSQQAHVLQGIEALALLAVLRAYPNDVLLLEHDGFVSRRYIPPSEIERIVREATGFDLTVSMKVNEWPDEF